MPDDPAQAAQAYFDAWQDGDVAPLREVLADDVTFVGPLGTADGVEECVEGIRRLSRITAKIDVKKRWVDGDDVLTWFELHTTVAPPTPVANWSRVEGGRITRIRVTFDPRGLAPPS